MTNDLKSLLEAKDDEAEDALSRLEHAAGAAHAPGAAAAVSGEHMAPAASEGDDMRVKEVLRSLDDKVLDALAHFRQADWIHALMMVKEGGSSSIDEALRSAGEAIMGRVEAATQAQYETMSAAEVAAAAAAASGAAAVAAPSNKERLQEMARWTPLRLEYAERELLRLLESTLYISDYTDAIDILHHKDKNRQMLKQIRHICSILTGLVLARNYEEGQRMLRDRDFESLAPFFAACFEIGRRYKIINPERMRDSYGQLMYFLMDCATPHVRKLLGFSAVKPVRTVSDFLAHKARGLELLRDPMLIVATAEIYETDRLLAQAASAKKRSAAKALVAEYATVKTSPGHKMRRGFMSYFGFSSLAQPPPEPASRFDVPSAKDWETEDLTEEDVELAIYSLADHMTFLRFNEKPVDMLHTYLTTLFNPDNPEEGFELGIRAGDGGARLTHAHKRQFEYVRQSLLLWREVLRNFFHLWLLADNDLLSSENSYSLRETGQGLNRIKPAPNVHAKMASIITSTQKRCGGWVGSSVIHLGDHNVPNALMFIDKYTQISRIVQPIIMVLDRITPMAESHREIHHMIATRFGSPLRLKKYILADFFKHAFDGSGGDNFFDAGSCIDGRLTSAWNWCQNLEKKPYYHIFLLCGFVGFDGKF